MDENKFIDAVVRAISGLEDSFRAELSGLRSDLKSEMERNIAVQNQNTVTVVTMLTSINNQLAAIRNDVKQYADHEDRIKKLEEIVLKKGA